MKINADTKLAFIFRHHPEALDAIVSIHPHYKKLKNPVLRKIMAARTSIAQAAKIGGCDPQEFFDKLQALGFEIENKTAEKTTRSTDLPAFVAELTEENTVTLDVRPILDAGSDPLSVILDKLKTVGDGKALKIINTFEPAPLMNLLKRQGYISFSREKENGITETWFKKIAPGKPVEIPEAMSKMGWDELRQKFGDHVKEVDVREMEMPQPMMTILEALNTLPKDQALFVHHKRIPVFLLPELKERHFDYRVNEISEENVELLIFQAS